ncbi:MAG: hypothetical protein M3331_03965, partial [Actinomycetota bacterium]|nr:hypothetical protein [Actinomycetota bacterium]
MTDSTLVESAFPHITTTPLTLTIDRVNDYLLAVECGYVVDGKPESEYAGVDDSFAYVLREAGGEVIGFVVNDVSEYEFMESDGIWHEPDLAVPEFEIPTLPIGRGTAGELIANALAVYDGILTANAMTFHHAVNTGEGTDIDAWRMCLATGELRAHYGLGYSLWEAGQFAAAYSHLRRYTELVPHNSWAWCWFGKA